MISFFLFSDVLASWGLADSGQVSRGSKGVDCRCSFHTKINQPKAQGHLPPRPPHLAVTEFHTGPQPLVLIVPGPGTCLLCLAWPFPWNHNEAFAHASASLCLLPDVPWCFLVWPSRACHSSCCREPWVRTSFMTIISMTALDTKSDYNKVQVCFKTLGLLHVQDLAGKEDNRPTCIQRFPLHREQK